MEYLLLAVTLLFLPGAALCYIFDIDKYRYLLSFSLSYSLFIFLLKSMSYLGVDANGFSRIYLFTIFFLSLAALTKYFITTYSTKEIPKLRCYGCNTFLLCAPVIIVTFIAIYFIRVGAYNELPADIFQHFEYMQETTRIILQSEKNSTPIQGYLYQNGKYWHYFYSFISLWTGTSLYNSALPASFFNTAVFLLGVFWFSNIVFKGCLSSTKLLVLTSLATVFFTFFHFGVNIFAFVRYYALAPVILNFVLYFAVMAIVIDFFREKAWNIKYLVLAGLIFYASLYVHRQEALFAILMVCIMSFYLFMQKHIPSFKLLWQGQARSIQISPIKIFTDKVNISFLLTQAVMVSIFIYSYLSITRHQIHEPKVIPLENLFPFFKNLYISNPSYQFYYVLTLWGAMVILLFILNIRKFTNNAFLMAGMLSPFFTLFNPFFVDLFLRHSWSLMLWRMSFLVPIHLVGAYLFVNAVKYIWSASYLKKVYGAFSVIILIILLFPFKTLFLENTYSRLHTLKPVPIENSPESGLGWFY
jgi:hypothetical protein